MPVKLKGSCRCGAAGFSCDSQTPVPYQRCYCTICRKVAGGGGYAINLGGLTKGMAVHDPDGVIRSFRAEIQQADGACALSTAERHFCSRCATALWLFSPEWPELVHPFASAVDNALPPAPASVHLMLRFKPDWVVLQPGPEDALFELYPDESLDEWHKRRGVWVA